MRPILYAVKAASVILQPIEIGSRVGDIKGQTQKLSVRYKDALVILYNKANLQLIAVQRPDENGNYSFLGLNTNLKTFVVAFDRKQQYNAVIQDNVVPK